MYRQAGHFSVWEEKERLNPTKHDQLPSLTTLLARYYL